MKSLLLIVAAIIIFAASGNAVHSISNEFYDIQPDSISAKMGIVEFSTYNVVITNKRADAVDIKIDIPGNAKGLMRLSTSSLNILPQRSKNFSVIIFGKELGEFNGTIAITGEISESIPVKVLVEEGSVDSNVAIKIGTEKVKSNVGDKLRFIIGLTNLLIDKPLSVNLTYTINPLGFENDTVSLGSEQVYLNTTLSLVKEFESSDLKIGNYILEVKSDFGEKTTYSRTSFSMVIPLPEKKILNVRLKFFMILFVLAGVAGGVYLYYQKQQAKKKRYKSKLDYDTLPKPGPRTVVAGMIAETTKTAYFDIDQLASHTIIAGSTGGGKTVSAEVLIEEALNTGAGAIVFDPTAQWTGFLRKNIDKKMFEIYPRFGMKPEQAKAFNGNVKQILNAREVIDIKRYIKPGEITSFAINRLEPEEIDILVASVMRQIFKANLPESKELKLIIIFDEVHRLLPKFGGSGQGFIQIERGAREFRKWGVGLILISQVLTDFIGQTKANIANEIQMRTRDQGDLDRIKNKYGDYMLQSLLKSATGTGMYENAAYNRGDPYFIAFRPLLHQHAALDDETLENYNKYNDIIDELEGQIDQLKGFGVDAFDLSLELKMALDKVKAGNFRMVDIYLESLRPRINQQWEKIGKVPKKREVKLISEDELKSEYEKAKEERTGDSASDKKDAAPKVKMLRLKNGIVVLNPSELEDAFNTMDAKTYEFHFLKGDFADWIKQVNPAIEAKIREAKTKEDALEVLKEPPPAAAEKKEEKK